MNSAHFLWPYSPSNGLQIPQMPLKTHKNNAFQALGVSKTIPHGQKLLGAYFKTYFDWKIN